MTYGVNQDQTPLHFLFMQEAAQEAERLEREGQTTERRVRVVQTNSLQPWMPEVSRERTWTLLFSASIGLLAFSIGYFMSSFIKPN